VRQIARLSAQLVTTAVLATVLSLITPVFVDRHEYAKAFMENLKYPTSETDTTLRIERDKTQRIALGIHILVAGAFFVVMNAGLFFVKRWSRSGPRS
jgi:hypothetical protein